MAIRVHCACGRLLEAPDALEGTYARCPACGAEVLVVGEAPLEVEGEVEGEAGAEGAARCARCGEEVPAGFLTCPHCGGDPFTGAASRDKVGVIARREPEEMGFFRLCLGMLIHPVRTSDELLFWLSRRDMLIKTAALFLTGILIWQIPLALVREGDGGLLEVPAALVVLSISLVTGAFFVALVGRVVSGQWLFTATVVGFAFMQGLVRWVMTPVAAAVGLGLLGGGVALLAVLLLWSWLLKLLVIEGIFGYGLGAAFLINFCAAILEIIVLSLLGFPLL